MTYTPFDYITMFGANFVLICLLGIQSKNVMQSRYTAAITVSFGISLCQFIFTKYAATGDMTAFATCAAGGCMGIAFSIWLYDNVLIKLYAKRNAEQKPKSHEVATLTVKVDADTSNFDAAMTRLRNSAAELESTRRKLRRALDRNKSRNSGYKVDNYQ